MASCPWTSPTSLLSLDLLDQPVDDQASSRRLGGCRHWWHYLDGGKPSSSPHLKQGRQYRHRVERRMKQSLTHPAQAHAGSPGQRWARWPMQSTIQAAMVPAPPLVAC